MCQRLTYTDMTNNKRSMCLSYDVNSFSLWNTKLAKMVEHVIMQNIIQFLYLVTLTQAYINILKVII